MNPKQNKGLRLRYERKREASWLTAAGCGVFLYALGALTGQEQPWLPAVAGMAACTLYLLAGNRSWPWALGAAVLALALLREAVANGFALAWNRLGDVYTAGTGIVLPALQTDGTGSAVFGILFGWLVGLGFCTLGGVLPGVVAVVGAGVSAALNRQIGILPFAVCALLLMKGRGKKRLLPVLALALILLLGQLPGVDTWAGEQSAALRDAVHEARYETNYTTLPEGDLTKDLPGSDAAALVVTMEKPEHLYLRGFTGAVLEGEQWRPLETEILAENEELLYWLSSREFDLRAQFAAAAGVEAEQNTVTVQNIGACSAWRYVPFAVIDDEGFPAEDLNSAVAGGRYDRFTTVYQAPALIESVLETLNGGDSRYLQAEAAYREFVREHYLAVPEGTEYETAWEAARGLESQEAVRAVLEQLCPDGAERSPRYATAAVLTARHFGIPARYAEGYIVPAEAGSVQVTGADAACWAEVYHDGIGWIPMALTPGLEQTVQEETPEETEPPETIPEESRPESEPEPDGGTQVRIGKALLSGLVLAILLVLLVLTALLLRRKWILRRRRALLEQGDIREAAAVCMADAAQMLARLGIERGNGSLDDLVPPIRERFGAEYAQQFAAAAGINARALFSSREMCEDDRKAMLAFRAETAARLKAVSGWFKQCWMQLVLCLY